MAKLETLIDDFSGGLDTTTKWTNTFGGVAVSSGVANIPCVSGYSNLGSLTTYDFTSSYIYSKITPPTQPGNGTKEFFFEIVADATNKVQMFQSGSTSVVMRKKAAGVNTDTSFVYAAGTHVWWRMREAGGFLFWDTSTNGTAWTQQGTVAHTMTLTAVTFDFSCGFYGTETAGDFAAIDNVNTSGVVPPSTGQFFQFFM